MKDEVKYDEEISINCEVEQCFMCDSYDCDTGCPELSSGSIWVRMTCEDCNHYWDLCYQPKVLFIPKQ